MLVERLSVGEISATGGLGVNIGYGGFERLRGTNVRAKHLAAHVHHAFLPLPALPMRAGSGPSVAVLCRPTCCLCFHDESKREKKRRLL